MTEESKNPEVPQEEGEAPEAPPGMKEEDSRIVVFMEGQTSTPKYVDFHRVSPFQLIAIGEWLSLKGKQIIAVTEQGEADSGILIPQIDGDLIQNVMKVRP